MHTVFLLCRDPQDTPRWRHAVESGAPDLRVVGAATQARRASTLMAEARPDTLLTELTLQDGPALHLVRELGDAGPRRPQVLLMVRDADDPLLLETLRNGADNYCVEGAPGPSVAARLHETLRGESELTSALAVQMAHHFDMSAGRSTLHARHDPVAGQGHALMLTPPERELLDWLSHGRSVAEVAILSQCSLGAVRTRIRGVIRKLQWDCRAGALSLRAA